MFALGGSDLMSFIGAVTAGIVGAFVFYVTTRLTTMNLMGMERYFGTLFTVRRNDTVGFVLLLVGGILIGLIYAALWSVGVGWPSYLYGLIFGVVQWLLAGLLIGILPYVHRGIRAGLVRPPGLYMKNLLGAWAFVAGMLNHVIFGLAFAYFYQFFISRYG